MSASIERIAEHMEALDAVIAASFETTAFLDHFKDQPDRRQAGKVMYPLDEVLLLSLLAVLAGAEGFTSDIARFEARRSLACSAVIRIVAGGGHERTIISAISSRPSTKASGVASRHGWRLRLTRARLAEAIASSTGRRSLDLAHGRKDRRKPSTWCRPSRRASGWCLPRRRSARSRTRSALFPLSSTCRVDRRGARHHRRDRMPARHRPADHRQESRLHSGAQG